MTCRSFALALCLALAIAATARAQLFTCSSLPSNWGSDSNDNQNGPWEDLSGDVPDAVYSQVYSIFESRYSNRPITEWQGCDTPEPSAVGCQQTAGDGMNYALQVNFTCNSTNGDEVTLGMTVDVNTYQQYINVDDMDVEFVAVNGAIVKGNLDEADWWESNDNIWGDYYAFNGNDNTGNDNDDDNDDSDDWNNAANSYWKQVGQQIGQDAHAAGEAAHAEGEAIGQHFEQEFGGK